MIVSTAAGPIISWFWHKRCMASVQGSCLRRSSVATHRSSTRLGQGSCSATSATSVTRVSLSCCLGLSMNCIVISLAICPKLCRSSCPSSCTPCFATSAATLISCMTPSSSGSASASAAMCTNTFSSASTSCSKTRWMSTPRRRSLPARLLCRASSPSSPSSLNSRSRDPSVFAASSLYPCSPSTTSKSCTFRMAGNCTQSSFEMRVLFVWSCEPSSGLLSASPRPASEAGKLCWLAHGEQGPKLVSVLALASGCFCFLQVLDLEPIAVILRRLLPFEGKPCSFSAASTGTVVTPKSSQRRYRWPFWTSSTYRGLSSLEASFLKGTPEGPM
mmetsp:Transcript_20844/g.62728  ORF Transcript_20844/g.62728 Transcript_20844/m.62728 type:complete len:331 (-) Transcript_20844:102-1094(-)